MLYAHNIECFGASALRRFGASALRRFGASALRRFGASALRRFGASALRRFGASALRRFGASRLACCLGLLSVIIAPLYAPPASAQTPTVTLSVPADTEFAEGEGNTTVTVTATLSAALGAATVVDLSLGGTAKSTDYTVVQLPDVTISTGQTVGTADLILRPVDDNFFEGPETVSIGGTATGVTVNAVDVALEDNETAPTLDVTVERTNDGHSTLYTEGESVDLKITVALVGATFEANETVSLALRETGSPGHRVSLADINYGTNPPWSLQIRAGRVSAQMDLSFTVVDDALVEEIEHVGLGASVTVVGTAITGQPPTFINISESDKPLNFKVDCHPASDSAYADDNISCWPVVSRGSTGRTYTVTMSWVDSMDDPIMLVSPASETFTVSAGSSGPLRNLAASFSLDAGTEGVILFYLVTVFPNDEGESVPASSTWYRVLPAADASHEITSFNVRPWPGVRAIGYRAFTITLLPRAVRPVELDGPQNRMEVVLDSGIVSVPCRGISGGSAECEYYVQDGDFDFDGQIEIRAGAAKFTRWRDRKDPMVGGAVASPLPAESTTYATPGMLIYGGGTAIDLSVSPQTVQEGTGEQALTIIAQNRLGRATGADLVLPLEFTNISTSNADYSVRGPLSVTIPAGQVEGRTTAVLFTPTDDLRREDRVETVRIEGSMGAAMTPFVRGADLSILDAAGITLSVSPLSIAEDGGARQVMVTATWGDAGDSALARDVEVALNWGGTAGAGDYARTGGATVTIPANARSGTTTVTLTPTDDNLLEGDETIVVEGSTPGRVVAGTELTLTDDEMTPAVTLSVDVDSVSESGAAETVTVSATLDPLVAMANDVTTVTLELGGTATAGTDYSATWSPAARQITIPRESTAGSNTVTLTLTPTDDSVAEGDETVVVQGTATTGSRSLVVKVATIAIEDDDTRGINLAPRTLTVAEGATDTYEVWLGAQPTNDVSVTLSSTDATTATVDEDELTFTTLTWNARQTVTLTGEDDDRNNADDERTASIRHTASGGGYDAVATVILPVTVTDDDEAASFSIADAAAAEGQAVSFTVTRSGATGDAATVSWSTADDATDGAHPASSTDDYTPQTTAQTLSFAAGDTSKTITVQTTQDTLDEENETFLVTLSSPSTGTSITDATATGTINDDDATPELSFGTVTAIAEGAADATATMSFTVNLSAASGQQVTVDYADAGTGTATAGEDYSLTAGTLTFATGDTSKTFAVTVNGDDVDEDNETVTVRLSSPVNALFAGGVTTLDASGTITDDDTRGITVSAATDGVTVAEADDPGTSSATENVDTYTVALDSEPTGTVTIDLESGDTDVATVSPASLEFTTASWGARTVTVTGVSDDVKNANDRRTTSITHTVDADDTDYEDETAADVTVTVTDDEAPTVEITGVPAKINSTAALSVTFTFSGNVTEFATGDVTVTGGTKGAFSGTGASYTLAVTPTGGSDVVVTVAADSASDTVGNTGPPSAVSATATWDAAVPTVEITGVPAKINSTAAFTATFTFSEDVTEFVTGDVTVTGGTKGAFAGTDASYTLLVTPTSGSSVTVEVAANSATDGVNTGPSSAVSATATWDAAAPTVAIGGVPAKINSTAALSVTFTFSEDVTEFVTGDVTVTGGTKGAFSGSGEAYTLVVTPTSGSNVTVEVAANAATDGVNTGPASAQSATATWDAAVPTVEIAGVPAKINSTTAFTATFTFSEDVTEFVTGDVTVTGGTKGMFSGSGRTYTLPVTPTNGSNVTVEVAANSATDGVNTGPASAVSATATWDAAAPTVAITGVPAKINSTAALSVTFMWSEDVTAFVTGDVTVTGGTKGAFASTSARVYTLLVTPTSGSNVTVEVAANAATDGVNTGPASAVSATATWDATAPTVMITGVPAKINSTAALTVTFTFSEDVTEFATGDVTVTGGTKGAFAGSGTTYTLVVTPSNGSNVTVEVAANAATDGVNTGPASAVSATATWDATAPTVMITGVPAKINSTAALTVTFTFSEDVTEFATGDVTVTGGTKGAFAGSGTTYTLVVTPSNGSNVTVEVAANAATDGVNTGPASAVSATATWDATAPTVVIGGVPAKINSTAALTATFTFSEDVTEFVTGDVTVTGGAKGAFASTSARVYTLLVTPTSGSNVTVEVAANAASDGVNTGPASAVSATATWDATAPTVEITGVPSKINSTTQFTATFTFSEDVTEFVTGDVTVTGGTKGAFSGSGRTYTLVVTPTNGSNVTVEVAANSASDGVNTGPASAVSATATWDATAPTVEITGVPSKINSTTQFTATFTFSEDVTEFVTGDVTVTGGTKGAFSGSGASYTLVVTPTGGSDVTVEVAADSATDGVNTGPSSAVSATATWDAAVPTVAITGVPSKINSTTAFTATFTFSESVTGFATGDVTVTGGMKGAFSGSGTSYTLVVTPTSGSNVTVSVAANAASDGVNTGPASAVSATATWDAAVPTVAITGVPAKINSTAQFTATFTFSEDVTEFATGDVTVTGGAKGAFASTSARVYTLVVTPSNGSNVTVEVAANAASDGVNTGPASAVSATATWDAAAPTVAITGVPAKINSTAQFTATFTFSEDVTAFVTGDVTVTGGTKGAFASTSARVYTLAVTPSNGSNVTVEVAANAASDGVNTGPASAVSATATWDANAPSVAIGGVPAKINSMAALTVTFTWLEDVTGFATGDVTVTGGTKGAFSGSGASYTLVVTPTSGSNVTVEVAANSATDGVNTGPSSAVSATATWDAAVPTVAITGVPAKINSTAALTATFTFSEDVTEFVTGDVTVTGGTKGAFSGSGRTYTLVVTPSNGSNVTVEVAANSATDGVNTGPASAQSATATWDAAVPTVAITGVPAKINSTTQFTATFTFSEDVTGFVTGDVTVTGGTKGAFASTSARVYTLVVTPTSGSNVTVEVAANAASDGVNTGPASAQSATATWDANAPTVAITGVPSKINSTTAFTATFTFSEDVTEFVTGDVTVTGGTKGAFASTSARVYTLVVTPTSGSNVTVEVAANSATDGVNTGPASAVSATATWDAAVPTVAIGGVPPKISSTTALTATFTFSEDVTEFVTGDVTVTGGAKGAFAGSGEAYTLVVTPTSGSNVTVEVAANSATDGINTGPVSAQSATATWDAAVPSVEIGGVPAKINSTAALTVTFTFSEDVTGFVTGDVTVTGGAKGAFSGSGASYTLVVTPTNGSDVTVEVAANAATDGLNTGPASAVSATATWDATAPSVAITGVPSKINSTAALSVTFTWSEDVTEFVTGDVTVTGGAKGAFSGSGRSYTLAVTPTGGSNVTVEVAANAATDGVNTGPASAVSVTATWDATAPTVAIGGVPPKINSTTALSVTFTFSESVTGFATGDVTVTGGAKGAFAGSGEAYTLVVTPSNGSNVTVEVAANAATDGVNAGPASAVSATATWDANAPSVAIGGVPSKINSTTALSVTFTWSEDVTGFATGDVTVTGGAKGAFSGSGTTYTLAVTPTSGSNVTVEVAANAASDGGGNTGPASAVSATATWDATAPSVAIGGVPSKINSTAALTATFTWSEDVTEFVTGDVTVTGGAKGAFSGSGTTYTLAVTPAGGSNVTVEVAANAATDGVNTGPASAQSATATWDATAPTVSITDVPSKINSTTAFTATFTFSEDVAEFATGDVTVTGGAKGAFSGSGTTYTLVVTPTSGSSVTVEVAANAATDGVNTGPASAQSATATWDANAPTVEITGVPAKINSTAQFTATFTFSENVTEFVTGDVTVTGGAKGAFSGSGTSYTLAVTPSNGSNVTVEVAANAASDGGGNTGPASAVSATATWDANAPTVEITGVPSKINSTAALSVTFTFSESVTGFVTGDVTVSGGTKGAFSGSGTTYTLVVTPTTGSNMTVEVAANSATDGVNMGPASAVSATATWDAAVPTVEITGVPSKINSTTAFTATFTFSESVTEFVTGDVTVTGGTKGAFSGSGTTYTLAVTPTSGSNVTVEVAANSASDGGGNTGPASAVSATATWDATAPTVAITGVPAKINSTTQFTATFTFSESVTGFVTGDVTVSGGTKGTFSGSGTTYTLAVTPSNGSDVTVSVATNSATDGINTGPASAVSATATWDANAPSVEIGGMPSTINSTTALSVTFTWLEDVTGFATGDVTVTGGAKGAFSGSGKVYTLAVTPAGGSNVTVEVAANAASDGGGNTGPASPVSATATWDAAAPTLSLVLTPSTIDESGERNSATVTATLSGPSNATVTVTVSAAPGADTATTDYTLSATTLTIAAGSTTSASAGAVTITAADNDVLGPDKTVIVSGAVTGSSGIADPAAQTLTIRDDDTETATVTDPPDISINSVAVVEGRTARFTLTLSAALEVAASVLATTEDGTARQPRDYRHRAQRVTIPAGDTRAVFEVRTVNDRAQEDEEYFRVRLSAPDNAVIRKGVGRGAIEDDDLPTLRLGDASAREGEPLTFELSIEPASTTALTLRYFTQDRTARAGLDYVAVEEETVTIEPGVTTRQITVPTLDDRVDEPDEAFRLLVTLPRTVTVIGTGTIIDDDAAPALTVADAAADEGEVLAFPVSLSAAAGYPVSVEWALTPGTAAPGEDYVAASGTLTIPAGERGGVIEVATLQDLLDEPDETLTLALSALEQVVPGEPLTALGTIIDDDTPPTLTIADSTVNEGEVLAFPVRLSAAAGEAVRVAWALTPGTAAPGEDYVAGSGTLTIPAGELSGVIEVATLQDLLDEPDETLTLALSTPQRAVLGATATALGTIVDDDAPPVLTPADSTVNEGEVLVFPVRLSARSAYPVSVAWALVPGTAVPGADYVADGGTLHIPAGARGGVIEVATLQDLLDEPDETLTLALSTPQRAVLGAAATALGTIVDDDAPPVLTLAGAAAAAEGEVLRFPVRLSGVSAYSISVDWALLPGTATPGEDYVADGGTLHIPAGERGGVIEVVTLQDRLDEPDETLTLALSTPQRALLGAAATALGAIRDDDAAPVLHVEDAAAEEGQVLVFTLRLSAPSSHAVGLDWTVAPGTATPGEDYRAISGTVRLAPGATVAQVEVMTLDDEKLEAEAQETVWLVLSNPVHVVLEDGATGYIADNDAAAAQRLGETNEAILPQVTAALLRNRIGQVTECLGGDRPARPVAAGLGGLLQRLPASSAELQDDARSLWERLGGTRFKTRLGPDAAGDGEAAADGGYDLTVCGGLDWRRLGDARRGLDWDGALYEAHLGGHLRVAGTVRLGLNVSQSYVSLNYTDRDPGVKGDWALRLTGVQPYVARQWGDGRSVWAMAGWGAGELTLTEDALRQAADAAAWQAALGGALPLQWGQGGPGDWQRSVQVKGDLWWGRLALDGNDGLLQSLSSSTVGGRALLESLHERALDSGAGLSLATGAGVRYDDGAGDAGLEWTGGLGYRGAGQRFEANLDTRALLLSGHTKEWGFSARARLKPRVDGSGWSFTVAPGWGRTGSMAETLWAGAWNTAQTGMGRALPRAGMDPDRAAADTGMTGRSRGAAPVLDAELGYGIRLPWQRGLLTPYSAFKSDRGGKQAQLGLRWAWRPGLRLALDAEYRPGNGHEQDDAGLFLRYVIGR